MESFGRNSDEHECWRVFLEEDLSENEWYKDMEQQKNATNRSFTPGPEILIRRRATAMVQTMEEHPYCQGLGQKGKLSTP